ncbi:MAG: FAD-dependent oxidoreductase [Candidatus Parcubacteria bacterium]|nr:FAD-dependent oxidoreductase [Burkholderiales bacterium]
MTQRWDIETELVVVGAGACGLMAAFAAARRGAEVLLLEKNSRLGCNTELASGSIPAAGTRFQKAAGVEGTAEQMAEDILRKNRGQADPEIVRALCRRSGELIDLLTDEVGLPLALNTDAGRSGFSFLRLHNPPGRTGGPLIRALHDALARLPNATFADETPGAGLIADAQGTVAGVLAGPAGAERIGARKVILACDGFGANREMLRRFIPEMAEVEYIGTQNNTGEGIGWGVALGAATAHMSGYQGHGYVCAGYGTRLSPEIPQLGGIFVNMAGERFTRDDQGYSEFARVVLGQPGGVAVGLFDQRIYGIVAHTDHFKDTIASGALRSGTLEELAAAFRVDAGRLRATLDEYNAASQRGEDRFGRKTFGEPLRAPYYGAKVTGALAHTQGGLKVDVHARVLRPDASVIPNLYAGGGTAAGISGDGPDGYLSGNGLLSALGLGLIAGEHAAAAIRSGA